MNGSAFTALHPRMIITIVVLSAITPALLMSGPVVAGQLAAEFGMSPVQIGKLFTTELGATSLATIPAWYWLSRFDWKKVSLIAAAVYILANIISALITDPSLLIIMRAISGLAGGSVMIICMTSAAMMEKPDRAYANWVVGQLVLGAVSLALLPVLFAAYGLSVFFVCLAVLMALATPLIQYLPHGKPAKGIQHETEQKNTPVAFKGMIGLAAILVFYLSLNGVWTFMAAIAGHSGISTQASGNVMAIASLLGIAGAMTAAFVGGKRTSFHAPLIIGYATMVAGILLLLATPSETRFTIAAFAFKYAWTFALPFILARVAALDRSGHLMSFSNLVIGGGLALGPIIGGYLIELNEGSYQALLITGAVLALTSLLLILSVQSRSSVAVQKPAGETQNV